jgi:MYXO-CTERM domain-containing protein
LIRSRHDRGLEKLEDHMSHTRHVIGLSAAIVMQLCIARSAAANCAIYSFIPEIDEETGTVVICADNRQCSGGGAIIRENTETGEVVEISGACQEEDYNSCWIDECVPAGTYRYGLSRPLDCGCGSSEIFVGVDVTTTVEGCVPGQGGSVVAREEGVPWGDDSSEDCVGEGCSVASEPTQVGLPVFALVGLLGLALMLRKARRG